MSVCDEGWGGDVECPLLVDLWDDCGGDEGEGVECRIRGEVSPIPRECSHAPALRAVVENPEMRLVAVPPMTLKEQRVFRAFLEGRVSVFEIDRDQERYAVYCLPPKEGEGR